MKRLELVEVTERRPFIKYTVLCSREYTDMTSQTAALRGIEEYIVANRNGSTNLEVHDIVDVKYPKTEIKVTWDKYFSGWGADGEEFEDEDEY